MKKVILQDAFAWICESCGKMNYSHPVADRMSEEDLNEVLNVCSPDGDGAYVERPPTIVACSLCRESFETEMEYLEELDNDA